MSDFSFSATARCNKCGAYLDSSDEECDHDGATIEQHLFRKINTDETVALYCSNEFKWYKLAQEKGEHWIEYAWLGERESVQTLVESYGSIEDVPRRAMSYRAPSDVSEEVES